MCALYVCKQTCARGTPRAVVGISQGAWGAETQHTEAPPWTPITHTCLQEHPAVHEHVFTVTVTVH